MESKKNFEVIEEQAVSNPPFDETTDLSMRRNFSYLIYDSRIRMVFVGIFFLLTVSVNIAYLRILTYYEEQK